MVQLKAQNLGPIFEWKSNLEAQALTKGPRLSPKLRAQWTIESLKSGRQLPKAEPLQKYGLKAQTLALYMS